MTDDLARRLLEAIAANRLAVFCGAGLSMASPSDLPSAAKVAVRCAETYLRKVGQRLPAEVSGSIEAMARYFKGESRLLFFLEQLVPWVDLRAEPNSGHVAVADLLECGVLDCAVTTNFDSLVERAAANLSDRDFRAVVDAVELAEARPHRPYLKLHGCGDRSRHETLWCAEQLVEEPVDRRLRLFRDWLTANLVGRDLLFVGFWTDWAYLTEVLAKSITAVSPQHVYVVDPAEPPELESKAPHLWEWAHGQGIAFHHVRESGADFLDDLRRWWSQLFLRQMGQAAEGTYAALFGRACPGQPDHARFGAPDLYCLRRDLTGTPRTAPVRSKAPELCNLVATALHLRLLEAGAEYTGHAYAFRGKRIRVVSGQGQLLSLVKAQFRDEPPLPTPVDHVICAGGLSDVAPADIVRGRELPTLVRSGGVDRWESHEAFVREIGGVDV